MSPSFYPSSIGSFQSSSVTATGRREPEPIEYPDHSCFYEEAMRIGVVAHLRARAASYLGPPIPSFPNALDAFAEIEAKGLPAESDVYDAYVQGWKEARDTCEAYYENKSEIYK